MAEPNGGMRAQSVLNVAVGVLISISGYVWSSTLADLKDIRKEANDQKVALTELKGRIDTQAARYDGVKETLDRVEKKIDEVLHEGARPTPLPSRGTTLGSSRFGP